MDSILCIQVSGSRARTCMYVYVNVLCIQCMFTLVVVQYAYYSISMIVRLVVVYYAYASTSVH